MCDFVCVFITTAKQSTQTQTIICVIQGAQHKKILETYFQHPLKDVQNSQFLLIIL